VKKEHVVCGLGAIAALLWWSSARKSRSSPAAPTASAAEKPGITLLLGAGFSQGLGITGTAALGTRIDGELSAGPHAVKYLALKARLQARFGAKYNFEVLVAALESCRVFGPISLLPGAPPYASVIPEIAELRSDLPVDAADRMFETSMSIINDEIGMDFVSALTPEAKEAMDAFFRGLYEKWQLNVATLNYDHAVETFVPDIFDGFVGDGDVQQFESWQFMRRDGRPRIAHIHGDLQFGITQGEKHFIKHAAPRTGMRWDMMWAPRLDGVIWTTLIAGGDKADKIVLQPYSVYYAWLGHVLLDSPRIVVIGYGVGDLHINAWLTNAALHHQGPEFKAVFIDRFDGDNLPKHLLGVAAIAAGIGESVDGAAKELGSLDWHDDIAVHGPMMVIRSGIPLSEHQRTSIMKHLG
jgi:hypothetical protein